MPDVIRSRLDAVERAAAARCITDHSARVIRDWLTLPQFAAFADELGERIDRGLWKELDDAFWTVIPFGTGGRRGTMYPVGSNAINDRTIGESAQGLADYVRAILPSGDTPSCAIAYDTRHRSEHFAKLCAEVLLAAGFRVQFLSGYRSTPELSFAVRYTQSHCGIMVTASHNPPSDNAVKVYWAGGVQVLPPHDRGIIDRVMSVVEVRRSDFASGVADGRVRFVEEEIDRAFVAAVLEQSAPGARGVSILYTPLHGVGASAVVPVLAGAGFSRVRLFGPQERPDGDFPNIPGHVANPENPAVLADAIADADAAEDDLVLASDPDCDRLGAAARVTSGGSEWRVFTGNQLAALLADWALTLRSRSGRLTESDRVITTVVTSGLVRRVAEGHGIRAVDNLLVGFKWIGQAIDVVGPDHFAFGCEESHGYLAGTHVRDKDAAVAALLAAEMTAALKVEGRSLHEHLDSLFVRYGCHLERQVSVSLPGAAGMDRMQEIMAGLRSRPPATIAGLTVLRTRDYATLQSATADGREAIVGTPGDVVIFDLAGAVVGEPSSPGPPNQFPPLSNAIAARPSGTEPKIKFYLFAMDAPCDASRLPAVKQALTARLDAMEHEVRSLAGVSVT